MTTTNPRRQCERLWAANKYLVLSHSNKIYLEIRNYLKNDEVSLDQVQAYIDQALEGFPPAQSVHIIITVCIQHKLLLYSALHRTYCPEAEMPGAARHRHSLCLTIQIPDPAQSFYLVGRQGFPRSPIFYQIFIQTTSYSTPAQYSPP